jgi:acyl-homoserine-lactone acylase
MAKATSVQELEAAQNGTAGIPWVNTMAADDKGDALYVDSAVVPNVPDALVQECATPIGRVLFQLAGLPALDGSRADGACAWRDDPDAARPGMFGPKNQPDTVRRDWVVNANDSYWLPKPEQPLEGFARIIGCEQCERSLRTRMVYRYVLDRLDGSDGMGGPDLFTHEQLKAVEHENHVFAAELAREDDDLQDVCTAAGGGGGAACSVLAGARERRATRTSS